ncbi:MAG: CBS domain-containing protein, partial [Nocardiaceae bacterium]|nr:CBS domain-containing protein [Nocardiaceae bacterium]
EVPEPIPITSSPAEAAAALARSPHNLLPVVDGEGHYVGCLSSHDLLEASSSPVTLINGLITHPTTVSPNAELREMLDTLAFQGGAPVLGDDGNLVGWLLYEDLLARVYPS